MVEPGSETGGREERDKGMERQKQQREKISLKKIKLLNEIRLGGFLVDDGAEKLPIWIEELINSGNQTVVDIGLVIALEEEFKAIFPQINAKSYYNPETTQYYYLFERTGITNIERPYRCVVTFIGDMGPTKSALVSDQLIEQFNPTLIVSIGIAGSMDKGVLIGSVVIAEQTDEYLANSSAKQSIDNQPWNLHLSGDVYKTSPSFVAHAKNFKYAYQDPANNWQKNCQQRLSESISNDLLIQLIGEGLINDSPDIITGHIASGPIVGSSQEFVSWLKCRDRKYLAIEMESAGVLNAAHKRAVNSLIIRGISDYSDERKQKIDQIGNGVFRRYAMNNAIDFLWCLIEVEDTKKEVINPQISIADTSIISDDLIQEMDRIVAPLYTQIGNRFIFQKGSPGFRLDTNPTIQKYFSFWEGIKSNLHYASPKVRHAFELYETQKTETVRDKDDEKYIEARDFLYETIKARYKEISEILDKRKK